MKQLIRTVLVFLIGLIIASLAAYLYFSYSGSPKDVSKLDPVNLTGEEEAFITALSGEVYIMRKDSIIKAETGAPLYDGDIIKVVDDSFCQVQFSTVASARIASNTIVKIKKLLNMDKSPDVQTEILTGSMLYRVNKLREGEKLEVKSEDKIFAVRGTTFMIDRNSAGTDLTVGEGKIAISRESDGKELEQAGSGTRYETAAGSDEGSVSDITPSDKKTLSESGNLAVLDFGDGAPALVKTGVVTEPNDAQIYVNGILSGHGKYTGLNPSGEEITFLIRKRGYADKVLTVTAVDNLEYRVVLDPWVPNEQTLNTERKLSSQQGDTDKLKSELEARTERLKEVEALILDLKTQNAKLESQAATSEASNRKLSEKILELEKTRTDLNAQVTELERKLKESTAREDKLRELIRQIQEISSDNQSGG